MYSISRMTFSMRTKKSQSHFSLLSVKQCPWIGVCVSVSMLYLSVFLFCTRRIYAICMKRVLGYIERSFIDIDSAQATRQIDTCNILCASPYMFVLLVFFAAFASVSDSF